MPLSLSLQTRKILLGLAVIIIVAIYLGRVVEVYRRPGIRGLSQLEDLERATRLAPDNAEFAHLLGLRLSASDQDDDGAIAHLRKAVALNPNSRPILA